jgi:hypothetical protein
VCAAKVARFEMKIAAMKYNGLRYLTKQIKGEPLTSETSVNKLHRASLEIEMDDFAVELTGQAGLQLRGGEEAIDGGTWSKSALELAQRGYRRRHTKYSAQYNFRALTRDAKGLEVIALASSRQSTGGVSGRTSKVTNLSHPAETWPLQLST